MGINKRPHWDFVVLGLKLLEGLTMHASVLNAASLASDVLAFGSCHQACFSTRQATVRVVTNEAFCVMIFVAMRL